MAIICIGFIDYNNSWWPSRTVLGSVLGGCDGVDAVCGWVGPCPIVFKSGTIQAVQCWARVYARPVDFNLRGSSTDRTEKMADDESGSRDNQDMSTHPGPRPEETLLDMIQDMSDMANWTPPNSPKHLSDTTISVLQIGLTPLSSKRTDAPKILSHETEYQTSITFSIIEFRGIKKAVTFTLHTNPTFISAHPCVGSHVVHRRELPNYSDNIVAITDLKSHEGAVEGKVLVINAQCPGGEAVARAWCAEKGRHAVVRRGKRTCYTCSVLMAGWRGLNAGVLIWS